MRVFWLRDTNRFPLACVASEFDPDNNTIAYGLSVYNPTDAFSKKRGRTVAEGRLRSVMLDHTASPFKWMGPLGADKPKHAIVNTLAHTPELPDQVRRAAKLWLNRPERKI